MWLTWNLNKIPQEKFFFESNQYNPGLVYLPIPTFTIKKQLNVGEYTVHPMDSMGNIMPQGSLESLQL